MVSKRKKYIDTDVETLKKFLRTSIGTTWAEATAPSDANLLGLDMTNWGGDRSPVQKRQNTPWAQIRDAAFDYRTYIKERLEANAPWHKWI